MTRSSGRKWLGIAARLSAVAIGVWLMASPAVLGYEGAPRAATLDRIVGPLVASFAAIAITESTRGARHANLVLGIVMVLGAPLAGGGAGAVVSGVLSGLAVATLSRVEGAREHSLGGGWRALRRRAA